MPAKSKSQQRFFGLVKAVQEGKAKAPSKELAEAAKSLTRSQADDFASTPHKGLPEKKVLSAEEKAACFRLGAILAGAEHCVPVRVLADAVTEKSAGLVSVNPGGLAKSIVTVSVLTGLPIGIASHLVSKKVQARSKEERELELRRNYYAEAARSLESGLPETNV